jgi:hypothetical protein
MEEKQILHIKVTLPQWRIQLIRKNMNYLTLPQWIQLIKTIKTSSNPTILSIGCCGSHPQGDTGALSSRFAANFRRWGASVVGKWANFVGWPPCRNRMHGISTSQFCPCFWVQYVCLYPRLCMIVWIRPSVCLFLNPVEGTQRVQRHYIESTFVGASLLKTH